MGLDIFLYHFKKPKINTSKTYTQKELDKLDLNSITIEENNAESILPKDLIENFTEIVKVEQQYWDWMKLYKLFQKKYPESYPHNVTEVFKERDIENDIINVLNDEFSFLPENVGSASGPDGITLTFIDYSDNDIDYKDKPRIEVSAKKLSELDNLFVKVFKPTYVYHAEEIDYQRKGLTEYGWELLPPNCCYSTDKDNVQLMVDKGGLSPSFINNWIDGETAIMGWW